MIEGTAINLKCARCIHCEMCSWIKDVNDGCDWFEEDKEYSYRIEIPDNATNGDVIKALFPNGKVIETGDGDLGYEIFIEDKYSFCSWFDGCWWNAPYQKGGKE